MFPLKHLSFYLLFGFLFFILEVLKMYLKSDDGCIYRDLAVEYKDGIYNITIMLDVPRHFRFNSQGKQISSNPYYTLHFE